MRSTRWRWLTTRDRHHVSGAKSDASDAKLLAELVRTDQRNHRLIAGESPKPKRSKCDVDTIRRGRSLATSNDQPIDSTTPRTHSNVSATAGSSSKLGWFHIHDHRAVFRQQQIVGK